MYQFIYDSNTFEDYMADQGLKLKDSYQPYWERSGNLASTIDLSTTLDFTGGSAIAEGYPCE